METPPPYTPRSKKNNTGLIIGLILGGIAICCVGGIALLGGAALWGINKTGPMVDCMLGGEQIKQAIFQYEQEKGRLPNAATWQDEVLPYYEKIYTDSKDDRAFFEGIPPRGDWGCKLDGGGRTGLAFNSDLSGKKLADVANAGSTPLIFEIEKASKNAHEPYKKRDRASSPKFMDKPRGWMIVMASGEVEVDGQKGNVNMGSGKGGFEMKTNSGS